MPVESFLCPFIMFVFSQHKKKNKKHKHKGKQKKKKKEEETDSSSDDSDSDGDDGTRTGSVSNVELLQRFGVLPVVTMLSVIFMAFNIFSVKFKSLT